jgi:hypothetical protein
MLGSYSDNRTETDSKGETVMSARGHRPRQSTNQDISSVVGSVSHFSFYGVGDYTRGASQDPAETVLFDMALDSWIGKGFAGMSVADVSGLRKERQASR